MKDLKLTITTIGLLFTVGVAWATVKNKVEVNQDEIKEIEEKVEQVEKKQTKVDLSLQRFEMQQMVMQANVEKSSQRIESIYDLLLELKKE